MSSRWSYKVVEVKSGWRGLKSEAMQNALNQLGAQGWELVSAQIYGMSVHLFLKKEQ